MIRTVFGVMLLVWATGCQETRPPTLVYVAQTDLRAAGPNQAVSLDLYLIEPNTQSMQNLTDTVGYVEADPCLDVKRQRVAYVRHSVGGLSRATTLRVMALDTEVDEVVYRADGPIFTPVWSNDGDRIAFTQEVAGRLVVKVINADGTGLAEVGYGSEPSWRQDDRAIFFSSRDKLDAESGDLTVHDLKTGLNNSLSLLGNGFSNLPRGTSVLYTTLPYSRRNEAVWLLDANGKTRRLSEPNKDYRDVDPVHIGGTALVAFTRIDVKTGKAAIYVVDRQAEDPVAVPLVEGKGNAYTRGGELLLKD